MFALILMTKEKVSNYGQPKVLQGSLGQCRVIGIIKSRSAIKSSLLLWGWGNTKLCQVGKTLGNNYSKKTTGWT